MAKQIFSKNEKPNFSKLLFITLSFVSLFIFSCGSKKSTPDLSAIPHADALPTTELSVEDKAKLLEASGKTIEVINDGDLRNMLAASDGQLYVYAFWSSQCDVCLENIKNLKSYFNKSNTDKIRIITVNYGDNAKTANLGLRSQNIVFDSYLLKTTKQEWFKSIDEEWTGKLPALFMVNKSEDLFLKYYKAMSENEIEAILQTLVI